MCPSFSYKNLERFTNGMTDQSTYIINYETRSDV